LKDWVPNYEWRCHRCGAVNRAMISICEKCEFPAVASSNEITSGVVDENLDPLSFSEKMIRATVTLGYVLLIIGLLILHIFFLTSKIGMFVGASLLVLGVLLVYVCSRFENS
jgi:hypothetical protein